MQESIDHSFKKSGATYTRKPHSPVHLFKAILVKTVKGYTS